MLRKISWQLRRYNSKQTFCHAQFRTTQIPLLLEFATFYTTGLPPSAPQLCNFCTKGYTTLNKKTARSTSANVRKRTSVQVTKRLFPSLRLVLAFTHKRFCGVLHHCTAENCKQKPTHGVWVLKKSSLFCTVWQFRPSSPSSWGNCERSFPVRILPAPCVGYG